MKIKRFKNIMVDKVGININFWVWYLLLIISCTLFVLGGHININWTTPSGIVFNSTILYGLGFGMMLVVAIIYFADRTKRNKDG